MKRFLYFLSMVVVALTAAACALDPLAESDAGGGGKPVAVDFNVGVKEAMTKANPEKTSMDDASGEFELYVAAFDKKDGTLAAASMVGGEGYADVATLKDGAASVKMTLTRSREYRVVFFAMKKGAYVTFFGDNSARFTIHKTNKGNDPDMDAFYASIDVTADKTTHEITLKRPFAQVNVLVPAGNVPEGQTAFSSEMTVKMPYLFDLYEGKAGATEAEVTFESNAISAEPFGKYADATKPYKWIAMNYVLVPESGKVDITSFQESGMEEAAVIGEVPVKVNGRTNLVGNLYEADLDLSLSVLIDPGFTGEEEITEGGGTPPGPAPAPTSDTIVFADLSLENAVQYSDPFVKGDMSVTFTGGGNDGKYYTTGQAIRIYGDGSVTVSSKLEIVKIEYVYDGDFCPDDDTFEDVDTGDYDLDTHTWTGSANSVTLTRATGNGHWRLQQVTVYYGSDNSEAILTHTKLGSYLENHTRSYVAGTDQYVREYDGAALTFVLMNPADNEQIVITGYSNTMNVGDAVTLTVDWKQGTTRVLSGSYAMTVIKDEGRTVWIADRRGNGFVIRK